MAKPILHSFFETRCSGLTHGHMQPTASTDATAYNCVRNGVGHFPSDISHSDVPPLPFLRHPDVSTP